MLVCLAPRTPRSPRFKIGGPRRPAFRETSVALGQCVPLIPSASLRPRSNGSSAFSHPVLMSHDPVSAFISRWSLAQAAERANYQLFVALGRARPGDIKDTFVR